VPTPLNAAVTSVTKQIQVGKLQPDPSNLALLSDMMAELPPAS
jgi:hypothetical protein